MSPRGVSVGYGAPMDGGVTPPPPPPWLERETGLPALIQDTAQQAGQSNQLFGQPPPGTPIEKGLTLPQVLKEFFTGISSTSPTTSPLPELTEAQKLAQMQAFQQSGRTSQDAVYANQAMEAPEETWADFLAGFDMGGNGGGAARPDFSAYRAALTEQAGGLNAQIQAMYNALGEEAGANVGRIQDIYGGAGEGIGNVYDSAAGNVADAFSSSQQQAADQMARLGIEAAAPAVIDPMALSQAEAVSGLEQGRASGQAAVERYGASAGGFGSQMAQVAQQQGTEMNSAILASLQNRLAESLAAEQTGGGGGGGGGMSVRDQLALREAFESRGQVPLEERKFAYEVAQGAAGPLNDWVNESTRRFMEVQFGSRSNVDPDEYLQAETEARRKYRQQVGLE